MVVANWMGPFSQKVLWPPNILECFATSLGIVLPHHDGTLCLFPSLYFTMEEPTWPVHCSYAFHPCIPLMRIIASNCSKVSSSSAITHCQVSQRWLYSQMAGHRCHSNLQWINNTDTSKNNRTRMDTQTHSSLPSSGRNCCRWLGRLFDSPDHRWLQMTMVTTAFWWHLMTFCSSSLPILGVTWSDEQPWKNQTVA